MKILVTGGAGYIGSVCTAALCRAGHEVVVVDNLSTGHAPAVPPPARLVQLDLLDYQALAESFAKERFDAVMHFAASASVGESTAKPLKYWQNNVLGSYNLLRAALSHGVGRFVFSSTCAVYGEPVRTPIDESHPRNPVNPYGRSKAAVEWMLEDAAGAHDLGVVILRYFNAAGAATDGSLGEDHRPETHLIPLALQSAAGLRGPLRIFGTDWPTPDGTCIRDFVHVEDLAQAHILALEACEAGRAVAFNVGTGKGHSVLEVVRAVERVTGKNLAAEPAPRRPGDVAVLLADPSKIQQHLGWKPRFADLDAIVASAWQWLKEHPSGYPD